MTTVALYVVAFAAILGGLGMATLLACLRIDAWYTRQWLDIRCATHRGPRAACQCPVGGQR